MIGPDESTKTAIGAGRRTASRGRRLLLVALAAVVAATTAVGPSRLAGAVGLASTAAAPAPGFLPEPAFVKVTAPSLRLTDLSAILEDQPIPLAGGGRSPAGSVANQGTVLLQFQSIDLDNLTISQSGAGPFSLAITNPGAGDQAATIGGPGETSDLWGVLNRLDLCLNISNLEGLAGGLPVVGGLLSSVLRLIHALVPISSDPNSGPCFSLVSLIPVLSALVKAGIPLPSPIPANNLDIDVYALHVTAPNGSTSLSLPNARLVVGNR